MTIPRWWSRSMLLRVSTVLTAITALAIGVVVAAAVFAEQSTGKGAAINLAGSLRMQSFALAVRVADSGAPGSARAAAIEREIEGFEARLLHPQLLAVLPADATAPLRARHDAIAERWRAQVRPLARAAGDDADKRAAFLAEVQPWVAELDRFVAALEADLESRLQALRNVLAAVLVAILGLAGAMVLLLRREVLRPLAGLARTTQAVRAGDFTVRAADTGPDEIGSLARDFNHMVEELGRVYGSLEAQIAVKTADLAQKNRSLALLYETASALAPQPLDEATLQHVADAVRRVLDLEAAVIAVRQGALPGDSSLVRSASDAAPTTAPAPARSARTGPVNAEPVSIGAAMEGRAATDAAMGGPAVTSAEVAVDLLDGERSYGTLHLTLRAGAQLAPWQQELAQLIGRHLGAALAAAEKREEHGRIALLEERSAIARELHDSLAQALAYMKIQLLRLSALLGETPASERPSTRDRATAVSPTPGPSPRPSWTAAELSDQARSPALARDDAGEGRFAPSADGGRRAAAPAAIVVAELREGVASASRQLRELLTTFRLKFSGAGLEPALASTVADLRARTGLAAELRDELTGLELSANEQIHVLQIVREALSNVEHHAHARQVSVQLRRADDAAAGARRIEVCIEDDGVGAADLGAPPHHFGLTIMRERAALLGGELIVDARPGGGTRVTLRFSAKSPFGNGSAQDRREAPSSPGNAAARLPATTPNELP
ncbi:MAG TPA: HAMP domain-containing protein [Burkholderiaceae bacterium]|nr:HAMP domain-containing protein [Burkholderiaceae bacterium]